LDTPFFIIPAMKDIVFLITPLVPRSSNNGVFEFYKLPPVDGLKILDRSYIRGISFKAFWHLFRWKDG